MSSIIKLHASSQHPHQPGQARQEIITNQSNVLDFTSAVVVNRKELSDAYEDVQSVSNELHDLEDSSDFDMSNFAHACRTLHHAAQLMEAMLTAQKGGAR